MSAERAKLLRELFDSSCDLAGAARDEFLDRRCADSPELRVEVEEMLRRDATPGNVLDEPLGLDPLLEAPPRVGAYRIVRRISAGSSGIVYEAMQDHPARPVAIKLLRACFADDDARRRFELEADILGRLDHAGIAHIHDAGVVDVGAWARPYLVMELIDGIPVDTYAQRASLGIAERVRLLAKICDGVGHAHSRGIIHRDLKAGNILVDALGQPHVVDFGVALVIDADAAPQRSRQTQFGQLLGTVATMSPEQARGEPDRVGTHSDVYALGVIAYELLCGRPPYDVARLDLPDALRMIRDDEPIALGQIDRRLRGDLEIIVAKALRKEPEARYASARELGDELRRFLRDEPIAARPQTTREQLARFARRNRTLVVATGIVMLTIVGAVVAIGAALIEARRSQRNMEDALADSDQVTGFFEGLLGRANPDISGHDVLLEDVLVDASRQIHAGFAQRPALEGRLLLTNGLAFLSLGRYEAAETDLRRAADLLAQSSSPVDAKTLGARIDHGRVLRELGSLPEAAEVLRTAHADSLGAHGEGAKTTLVAAEELAELDRIEGRFGEARTALEGVLATWISVFGADDIETARCRQHLGHALIDAGIFDLATVQFEEALRVTQLHAAAESADVADATSLVAGAYQRAGRLEDARTLMRGTADKLRERLGESHPQTLCAMLNLAQVQSQSADYAAALETLAGMLALCDTRPGKQSALVAEAVFLKGATLLSLGRAEEAEPVLRDAIETFRVVRGNDHWETLNARMVLAGVLMWTGRSEQARDELLALLPDARRVCGAEHLQVFYVLTNTVQVECELSRFADAQAHALEAIALGTRILGKDHPKVLGARTDLAKIEFKQDRIAEANAIYEEVVPGLRNAVGPEHESTALAEAGLARTWFRMGRQDEAIALMIEVERKLAKVGGEDHFNTVSVRQDREVMQRERH